MEWFEKLTGFREGSYAETQARLSVVEGPLQGSGRAYAVGTLTLPSLADHVELRGDLEQRASVDWEDVRR